MPLGLFRNFRAIIAIQERVLISAKDWKLAHISAILSTLDMWEKHILYASILFSAGSYYHKC